MSNGLDSSTLINLIVVFDCKFDEFKQRGFTFPPNLFFYHEISRPETIGVLINKHKFTHDEATEAFEKLVLTFQLQKIIRNPSMDEAFEHMVKETNKRIVKNVDNKYLTIGTQDVIILAGFLRSKINIVHSADKGFLKTCEELGINTAPLPERDAEKEKQIKSWMKNREC